MVRLSQRLLAKRIARARTVHREHGFTVALTLHHVLLMVQDNGLGISENGRSKLFGMFQRLHDHVEGSGIGLYMVKRMVENVGGRIEVESEVGTGSTFTVYFPR